MSASVWLGRGGCQREPTGLSGELGSCDDAPMKRMTISLSDDLAEAVEREARRRRKPVSHLAREALASYLGRGGVRSLSFVALGRSGTRSTARHAESIINAEWHARDR